MLCVSLVASSAEEEGGGEPVSQSVPGLVQTLVPSLFLKTIVT